MVDKSPDAVLSWGRIATQRSSAMQQVNRVRRMAAVVLAAGLMASGCGLSGGGDSPAAGTVDGQVTGTISFQTWNLRAKYSDYFNGVIKKFQDEHPGTTITWLDQPA